MRRERVRTYHEILNELCSDKKRKGSYRCFAAADPARVIPSCVIGSAVAGALSMAFECTLRAPHGGIFVVPTIGNPLMYLLAIAIGAVVSMILLAILKKPLNK